MKKLTLITILFGLMMAVGAVNSYAGGPVPVEDNGGTVGNMSCDGDSDNCTTGDSRVWHIGNMSCNDTDACIELGGQDPPPDFFIGNKSCNGNNACHFLDDNVGNKSCSGTRACFDQMGEVGNNSCNGSNACDGSTATIGNNSCNGIGACCGQSAIIGDNECNGDDACSRGCV